MKKKMNLGVLFVLAGSLLASCGGSGTNKIVLKIGFWPEASQTKDVAMYQKWADKFMEDNPEYEIKGMPYTYNTETVGQKATTGSLPDVWQTWFTEPEKLKSKNFIRPITNQLKALGWDEKMDDEMKATLTFNNDIYGIPRDGYGLGLLINKRILGENGLLPSDGKGGYSIFNADGTPAYPTTWAEVSSMSETIVEMDNAKGFFMYSSNKNGGWVFSNIAWNFGAKLEVQENGKWVANLDCDEAVNALEWLKEMKINGLCQDEVATVYNDWYSNIGEKAAMAVVGSDVLQNAKLQGSVDMSDLAFVPMPTGNNKDHYSLYGGTPFVFTKGISDEKVEGILKFFDYIGRSPSVSKTNMDAKKEGYEVAKQKDQPILPSIMPWKDSGYLTKAKELEDQYVNVNMTDYAPFFDSIQANKHSEEPYNAQEMYEALDTALQSVFSNPETANCKALLQTASATLQKSLDKGINA